MTSNCKEIDFACNKSFSFCKNNSASFFTISNASFSFSTSVNRETIPPLFSFNSSSFLPASSIGSTYWFVPMISSIYSNNPSSPGFTPFGFIIEICSTSPCKIKNRLLFKSTPLPFNKFVTSVKLEVFLFTKYFEVLLMYASLAMVNSEFGTEVNPSGSVSESTIS